MGMLTHIKDDEGNFDIDKDADGLTMRRSDNGWNRSQTE